MQRLLGFMSMAGNYKSITIASIPGKLFESCLCPILDLLRNNHSNQFGFFFNGDTNKTTFAVKSVINYFKENGSVAKSTMNL